MNWKNRTWNQCAYPLSSILPVFYLIEASLTPFIVMIITTSLTLNHIYQSRTKLRRYSLTEKENENGILNNVPGAPHVIATEKKTRDFKFAFNSVIFNILFILLTFPSIFVHLYHNKDMYQQFIFKMSTFIIFSINFASHFWVHFCVNTIFRNEVLNILRIKKENVSK